MRIVTFSGNLQEFIISNKDEAHAHKLLSILKILNPGINTRMESFLNLEYYQSRWISGSISNAEYLLYLNFMGNRSFNDPTQYPIFPWVISDYKSERIDLNNPKPTTFRDLSKPVGAQSQDKLD